MPRFFARSRIPVPVDALFDWHARPGALQRLLPPWAPVRVTRPGGIRDGDQVELRMGPGPFALRWVARHRDFDPGRGFVDEQLRGPFARWTHHHRMRSDEAGSLLADAIDYELPVGAPGRLLGGAPVRRSLERAFRFRHLRTLEDLRAHRAFVRAPRLRVAISGATGAVGRELEAFLTTGGHQVVRVTRSPRPGTRDVGWRPEAGEIDAGGLEGLDAVVHLAGENVLALRWSEAKKRAIRESRVQGTRLLADTLASLERPPRSLVSASAIGFYGHRGEEPLDESAAPGEGFLAEVCRAWEDATGPAEKAGLRVVTLRIGVVLSARSGALASAHLPFWLGLGGRLGSGRQGFSWISMDDLVGAIHFLLQRDDVSGPVNATAPSPVTSAGFSHALARCLGRPALLPVPAFALRAVLGELADEAFLKGATVLPGALEKAGYGFRHGRLEQALRCELGREEAPEVEIEHRGGRIAAA